MSERCGDIGHDKGGVLESEKIPETLYEEHDVLIVFAFPYQYYLTLPMCPIHVEVEVS